MRFTETPLPGAWIIDIEPLADERGFFARTMCQEEFGLHGLATNLIQQSVSWNPNEGTLRGLHYQTQPHEEEKLVRVTRGAIFDVLVDVRRTSPSFGQWFGIHLSAENRRQVFVPKGVAHGFQTTAPDTEVFYQMSVSYDAASARGLRWNDPELAIAWPLPGMATVPGRISAKDMEWPTLAMLADTIDATGRAPQ
jgi:dTDP-4-dehydrorhamnose 3,5-epimerase